MWYSRSATVGGRGRAPSIQSAKLTPTGVSHRSDPRTHSTGVETTRSAHSRAGSPPAAGGGAVRAGSRENQLAIREDFQPVRRPCRTGELAKAPTRTGPSACRAAHRPATAWVSPASSATCTADVEHMPLRPCGPSRSNAHSIAV
ncbi:hypothetical protein WBK50_16240 [Pseudonocardia sp. T1-2H]|uniref:hypothetical protein n=1 Tax=Pseudonocardia sp. T1-2H TaxID=3128899 RepID=UPI003101AEEC